MAPLMRVTLLRSKLATVLVTTQFAGVGDAKEPVAVDADEPAYQLASVYTADLWRNARGGLRTGSVYLDNLDVTFELDAERAWGWSGVSAFVYGLHNNSARFSERYVGDAMTISNIDAPEAARLYEAWVQWESDAAHALSVKVGLYDLNSEFDASDSRSLFIHSTHGVGHDLGQTGQNGPSIFPVTSLAVRAAWSPAPEWRMQLALLDGVPGDPEHPSSNRIRLGSDDGILGIVELQWSGERIQKLWLGHWRYTAQFEDLRSTDVEPWPERDDNRGTYAGIELALDGDTREEPATIAFARYGVAENRINEFENSWSVGVRHRGLFVSRSEDELGIAYARADVSKTARMLASRDRYEATIELTYRAALTDWLIVQPDIQFIRNPGADPSLRDSLVFGLRLEFSAGALL
ncbi:MAG TPA: carbohydrate porin [Steroidobacter sp.]